MVRFTALREVTRQNAPDRDGWRLYLQWGLYQGDGHGHYYGYRYIWRRPNGSLQAARGQARLPSLAEAEALIKLAREQGWGDYDAESDEFAAPRHVVVAA